jgi:hypothetical protein
MIIISQEWPKVPQCCKSTVKRTSCTDSSHRCKTYSAALYAKSNGALYVRKRINKSCLLVVQFSAADRFEMKRVFLFGD